MYRAHHPLTSRPSSTHFTVSSSSERVVIYPEGGSRTHSGSASTLHSPGTSDSRSFSDSAGSEGWTEVEHPYEDDGIGPSDSASRARQPPSRRHTTEARPAPVRRHSSRRLPEDHEETLRHRSSHRHHSSRHRRSDSRRVPSDESASTVASADDHPYSHYGVPPVGYPPSGYRHVPAPPRHSGYPPSMTSNATYHQDPYQAQALVHMSPHDPFGYPSANPFSPGAASSANPFSPMAASGATGYFSTDPHAPPVQHHPQRPAGPGRPQSMYAPSSAAYGSELIAPYHHQAMPGVSYGGYPMPSAGYPPMPFMYPPSQAATPAPVSQEKVEVKVVEKKDDSTSKELENLREMIKRHEEERVAREKAMIAKAEADAAAAAAKKAREEEEIKKIEEIKAAAKKAKDDAEKAAADLAKKIKEEHDAATTKAKVEAEAKLAETKKKQEDAEKEKAALEAEVAKNKPTPDSLLPPIRFKDAVGRKFSFPWQLCKTWKGMEGLIKQAFAHVENLGEYVQQGRYDLAGPDGEIILPQVWDTVIRPDWEIVMHMWPMPEHQPKKKKEKDMMDDLLPMEAGPGDPFAGNFDLAQLLQGLDGGGGKPSKGSKAHDKPSKSSGSKSKKKASSPVIEVPPPRHGHGGGGAIPNFPADLNSLLFPGGIEAVADEEVKKSRPRAKTKTKEVSGFGMWLAGGRPAKKDDEKLELVRHRSGSVGAPSIRSSRAEQAACLVM